MKNRTLGIAAVAVLLTLFVGFLFRDQIAKKASDGFYWLYDEVMGIPH